MDTTNTSSKFFLPAAVILAGLFIASAVFWNNKNPKSGVDQTPQGPTVNISDVKTDGEPFIGNANAPVTLAFWSDYQCPFCKAFEVGSSEIQAPTAFPDIVKNYVETGKVKVVFKDVVFLSPRMGTDSMTGAVYSQAVWKLYPDKYLAWRTAMFNAQDQEGGGFGDAASIDKLNATVPGLDAAKIIADVKANKAAYEARANAVTAEAQNLGVDATPAAIIGAQLVKGAYPYAVFQAAIDAVLAK